MENKKSFAWSQGLLFASLGVCGCIALGLMLPVNLKNLGINTSSHTYELKQLSVTAKTSSSIDKIRNSMLDSWQSEAKTKGLMHTVPKRFQSVTLRSAKLAPGEKVIALTFDDGPWQGTTAQILDILKKNNIKATFFVVGQVLQQHPELGRRVVNEGHVIANHTWHHWYHAFSPQAAAFEIDKTSELIREITGVKTTLFRPPGGMLHNGLANYAKAQKQAVVLWSSDSNDYKQPSVPKLISNVMRDAKPGGIVLMHDGGGNRSHTVQALPQIINNFRKQGYRFATVPELLEMQDKEQTKIVAGK